MGFTIETMNGFMAVSFDPGTVLTYKLVKAVLQQQRGRVENLTLNDIWDARGILADPRFNSDDVIRVIDDIRDLHVGDSYHQKTAMVVDSDEFFGIARIFQTLGENFPYEIQIFRDMKSARRWIETAD